MYSLEVGRQEWAEICMRLYFALCISNYVTNSYREIDTERYMFPEILSMSHNTNASSVEVGQTTHLPGESGAHSQPVKQEELSECTSSPCFLQNLVSEQFSNH